MKQKYEKNNINFSSSNTRILDRNTAGKYTKRIYMQKNAVWNNRKIYILAIGILAFTSLYFTGTNNVKAEFSTLFSQGNTSLQHTIGMSGAANIKDIGLKYIPTENQYICGVNIGFNARNGTSTDNWTLSLWAEATNPAGAGGYLMTTSIVNSSNFFANGVTKTEFNFSNCQALNAYKTYYFGLTRTTYSDINNFTAHYYTATSSAYLQSYDILNTGGWLTHGDWYWDAYGYSGTNLGYFPTSSVTIGTYSTSTYPCEYTDGTIFSSSTIGNIGCMFQRSAYTLVNILFVPTTGLNYFNSSTQAFSRIFPFDLFFNFNATAKSALENYNANSTSTISIPGISGFNIGSVTILTSSSLSNTIGTTGKNAWFTFVENIAWLALGIKILTLIL